MSEVLVNVDIESYTVDPLAPKLSREELRAECIKVIGEKSALDFASFPDRMLASLSKGLGARLVRAHPKYLPWAQQCDLMEKFYFDTRTGKYFIGKNGRPESPRIFLEELPEKARGQSMKTMKIECGITCGIDD